MAKFSLSYVKSNPLMFGAIIVVFGLGLWLLMNRGASGGSSSTVVQSGPSEALQAASLQTGAAVQMKQIEAAMASNAGAIQLEALSRQIEGQTALATYETQLRTLELAATERLSTRQIEASLLALETQMDNSLALAESNNQFQVDYARVAADSATQAMFINAALQRDMAQMQADAFNRQAVLSIVPTLKKKDRDDALAGIAGYTPVYGGTSGGGFDPTRLIGGAIGAIL